MENTLNVFGPPVIFIKLAKIKNGGIIATIIDCHAMGTSMAYAHKHEKRLGVSSSIGMLQVLSRLGILNPHQIKQSS